jgi:hypothetical protein
MKRADLNSSRKRSGVLPVFSMKWLIDIASLEVERARLRLPPGEKRSTAIRHRWDANGFPACAPGPPRPEPL